MGLPYEKVTTVVKSDGDPAILAMAFPSRVDLYKIVVYQKDANNNYTVDLFSRNPAGFDDTTTPEDIYKVIPTQTASGTTVSYFPYSPHPFFNQDPDVGFYPGNNRALYVRISGAATGTFHVAIAASGSEF